MNYKVSFDSNISIFAPQIKDLKDQMGTMTIQQVALTFFCNILTLSFYSTYKAYYKEKTIALLPVHTKEISRQAFQIAKTWDELNRQLAGLNSKENVSELEIAALEKKRIETFSALDLSSATSVPLPNLAFRVMKISLFVIKNFVANILTFGFYGLIYQDHLSIRIRALADHQINVLKEIRNDVKTQSDLFDHKIGFLKSSIPIRQSLKELRRTEKGRLYQDLVHAQETIDQLAEEIRKTHAFAPQLDSLRVVDHQIHRISMRNEEVRKGIQEQSNQIVLLTQDDIIVSDHLDSFADDREMALHLQLQIRTLEEGQAVGPKADLLAIQKDLGILPAEYSPTLKVQKGFFASLFKYVAVALTQLFSTKSQFDERLSEHDNALDVLKACFLNSFDELMQMKTEGIVFNESYKIYINPEYKPNLRAFYNYMAFHLINQSHLKEKGSEVYLKINKKNVTMGASRPEMALNVQQADNLATPVPTVTFNHQDDFSPKMNDSDVMFGIDPISAKRLMEDFSVEERRHLFNFLMAALIPDNDKGLQATKEYLVTHESKAKLIRTAADLIKQVALAFSNRYKNLFLDLWQMKAPYEEPDDDVQGAVKPLEPLLKARETNFLAAPTISWVIKENYFTKTPRLLELIKQAKINYLAVFKALTKECVANPLEHPYVVHKLGTEGPRIGIAHQYFTSHYVTNHGCLMANLLAITVCKHQEVTSDRIAQLKLAMADFLDQPDVSERFKEVILATHGNFKQQKILPSQADFTASVKHYQSWLRGRSYIDPDKLGELEITLVAELIGVRIGVFRTDTHTKLDANQLMVPAAPNQYFGPNTKETLYLFNSMDMTFYGLFPKLNVNKFNPLSNEVQNVISYWHKDWS